MSRNSEYDLELFKKWQKPEVKSKIKKNDYKRMNRRKTLFFLTVITLFISHSLIVN